MGKPKDNLTLSNGMKINFRFPETKRLKGLQRNLSRKENGSKNREKARQKVAREYERINNRKQDAINKIFSFLKLYDSITYQNDNFHAWQKGLFSKAVHYSGMGKLREKLRSSSLTIHEINRFEATSVQMQTRSKGD